MSIKVKYIIAVATAFLLGALSMFAQVDRRDVRAGNRQFRKENWREADIDYRKALVRGTTSLRIVRMLREAGATEVHVRIASPMIKFPCFYGVDISTYDELLCARRTLEEARQKIEADSLAFLSESALYEAGKRSDLCLACFSGVYPTALYSSLEDANKDGKF